MQCTVYKNLGIGPGGEVLPIVGHTGMLRLRGGLLKGRENCHFSIREGYKISCKVEEMVAKAKYIKGDPILAEMTTQRNQND